MEDEITLLTEEQVENSEVLKKYGIKAKATYLYKLQGGRIYDGYGSYWTKTPCSDKTDRVYRVDCDSDSGYVCQSVTGLTLAVRPVIPLSKIYQSKEDFNISESNGIEEVEYGEYPQSIANEKISEELKIYHYFGLLLKTNKEYTMSLDKEPCVEYVYKDNKYVMFKDKWFKVEPIKWLIDKKEGILISKKLLTAMSFSYHNNSNYEKSDIKAFLEKHLIKEIIPSKVSKEDMYNYKRSQDKIILKPKITDLCRLSCHNPKGQLFAKDRYDFQIFYNLEDAVDYNLLAFCPIMSVSKLFGDKKEFNNVPLEEVREIEYGEYPQSVVDEKLNKKLERRYCFSMLSKTSKIYHFFDSDDDIVDHHVFEYKGNNYVRSNGNWFKVEPIKWIVDSKTDIIVSKNALNCMSSWDYNKIGKYFNKDISGGNIVITKVESEKSFKQKELLNERLEKSRKVHDDAIEEERKAREEAQRLEEEKIRKEEERQQEIKNIEDSLVNNFRDLNEKYSRLLELDSTKEIKYPHISIDKDILCDYDTESKSYKIKDKFIPYLSYIQFPYDMKDVDVRGLDLSNSIVNIDDVYNKSLEGCNLNRNKYVLYEVNSFDGYNLCDASVYSDTVLFLRGAYVNSKTIESINKKYISEALDGAILDKESIEFLNNHREEYGINKSINVKVKDGENIDDVVLFSDIYKEEDNPLLNDKYNEIIKQFEIQGITGEEVMNIAKLMIEREKNNSKHM